MSCELPFSLSVDKVVHSSVVFLLTLKVLPSVNGTRAVSGSGTAHNLPGITTPLILIITSDYGSQELIYVFRLCEIGDTLRYN